jgi:toxin ParE1/3/4
MRIVALAEALKNHPYLGRAGSEPGLRELVVGGSPYLIIYKIEHQQITISTVWHGAQSPTTKRY